jgi:hypothetical protein
MTPGARGDLRRAAPHLPSLTRESQGPRSATLVSVAGREEGGRGITGRRRWTPWISARRCRGCLHGEEAQDPKRREARGWT